MVKTSATNKTLKIELFIDAELHKSVLQQQNDPERPTLEPV
jgi:hypothetical protein